MLTTTLKPRPCKQCKSVFNPTRPMQVVCGGMCGLERARIKREAKEKAEVKIKNRLEREQFKARKEKLKRIPDLIKEAQTAFNAFIRERDRDQPCICCGRTGTNVDGLHAHGWDAGHYRSTGSASHLRFNEDNCHRQLVYCNRHGAGRAVDYRIGLVVRIGIARVEALEASNAPHKWERDELIAIKALYVGKLKEMKRALG